MTTHRFAGGEVRAAQSQDGQHFVLLQAISPGVVDDFGSLWNPHAFDESLGARLPTLCWAHDWADPIGAGLEYTTSDQGPQIRFRFDDFTAVPQAFRAFSQVESGTIADCSVGFSHTQRRDPTDAERIQYPGVMEVIEKADLDEVSLVLRGAVPGAVVLAVRAARAGIVDRDAAGLLLSRLATGELTLTQALNALEGLDETDPDDETDPPDPDGESDGDVDTTNTAGASGTPGPGDVTTDPPDPEQDAAVDALLAEADDALAIIDAH